MSLDRFRNSHPQAYEYYRGKFVGRIDDGLKSVRAALMRSPHHEPSIDHVVPLNAQIQQLEQITRSAMSDHQPVHMDYVSKLAEFKAKYQSPETSPKKCTF
jgi:hypothetical protein